MNETKTQWHPAFCSAIKLEFMENKDDLEYKSPGDELNIDTFFKTIAYASLYKSNGEIMDCIKADDITISFVRENIPVKLFRRLKMDGHIIEEKAQGIYYIHCNFYYDIQVIVSRLLNADEHIWLTSLTKNLTERNAKILVNNISSLYNKDDKEYADSVLQVVLNQNMPVFDNIKEGLPMCEAVSRVSAEKDAQINDLKAKLAAAGIE